MKLFLDSETDVKASRTDDGATPLHVAAQNGYADIVKLLVDNASRTDHIYWCF